MSSEPFRRDNHYVSRGYLKRWAGADGRTWTYRLLVSHPNVPPWRRQSLKAVARHEHFYTRVAASGETDETERWLDSEFEAPAEDPIRKAVSDMPLSVTDWERLIRFTAAQDARTPARLVESLKRWDKTLPEVVQETLEKSVHELEKAKREGRPINHKPLHHAEHFPIKVTTELVPGEAMGKLRVHAVAGRNLWLYTLRHVLTETLNALLAHRWTILRSPPNFAWTTSDDPVVRLNYYSPDRYDFRGGWGSKGTEIFLPLDPHHLLYTRIGSRPPRRGTVVGAEFAESLQRFIIEHAHRYVFAVTSDPDVIRLRPRRVDAALFAHEAELWRRWHDENITAERELHA